MSYGMVVALAGDYFGDWTLIGCPPSISDGWDNDPESSISRFEKMAWSMTEAAPELVHCLLAALGNLDNQLCEAYIEGQDPAQIYSKISDYYNTQFALCPGSGYLHLSLCNWDHFGEVIEMGLEKYFKSLHGEHVTGCYQSIQSRSYGCPPTSIQSIQR